MDVSGTRQPRQPEGSDENLCDIYVSQCMLNISEFHTEIYV